MRVLEPNAGGVPYGDHRRAPYAEYAGRAGPRTPCRWRRLGRAFGSYDEIRGGSCQTATNGGQHPSTWNGSESMGSTENQPILPRLWVQILLMCGRSALLREP